MSFQMFPDSLLYLEYLSLQGSHGLLVNPGGLLMWIDTVLGRMPPVLLLSEHAFGSFQSAQQMLQLLHFWWQWSPSQWVLHEAIVSQCSGIMTVSLCPDTHGSSPQFDAVWVRQTYLPLLLVGKVSEVLFIPTSGFHDNEASSIDFYAPLLYLLCYGSESLLGVRELAYEDSFVLTVIPKCNVKSFLTNIDANIQSCHGIVSLCLVWGCLTTWYAGSGLCSNSRCSNSRCSERKLSLYSLRLPRQPNRSTYELFSFHFGSRGNISDLLEATPFQRESGTCQFLHYAVTYCLTIT